MNKSKVTKKIEAISSKREKARESCQTKIQSKLSLKAIEEIQILHCKKQRKLLLERLLRQKSRTVRVTSKEQHKNSTLKRAFQRQEKEVMAISNIDWNTT